MRDIDPWDREGATKERIRQLNKTALRMRGLTLLGIAPAVVATVAILPQSTFPPAIIVLYAGGLAYLCSIFARTFPAMFRQWRELTNSARDIGITRLHYAYIVVEILLVAVPAIGALIVFGIAMGLGR